MQQLEMEMGVHRLNG